MPTEILMPALSPTMEEGKLAKWLVKEGDAVKSGTVIAEIETDKATMEFEAVEDGTIGRLLVPEGAEHVKVNQPIALLLLEGENGASAGSASAQPKAAPQPQEPAPAAPTPARTPTPFVPPPLRPHVTRTEGNGAGAGRILASPLARRLARDAGLDLAAFRGTGPHGRIVKRDIEEALRTRAAAGAPRPERPTPPFAPLPGTALQAAPMPDEKVLALYEPGSYEIVPHDAMRRVIAERLTYAKQTIPHFYLTVDCRLDELLSARERLNGAAPREGPRRFKLSVNDFIIKAMALALQQVPAANVTWTQGGMLRHKSSDVGVAVAVEGGLYTPVIRHAELKTLSEISNEMKDLAERARRRRLAPHEYQGGTTSISNLGMYGVKSFEAVINPPHATILAVGMAEKRPVVTGSGVEVATIMSCTLSCDHRAVDGATGAELLAAFKTLIEDPVRMLL